MLQVSWCEAAAKSLGSWLVSGSSVTHAFSCHWQVNFIAMHHLLDFGSGFDQALIETNRRDWKETLQFVSEPANHALQVKSEARPICVHVLCLLGT